jgi:hypothetical protein
LTKRSPPPLLLLLAALLSLFGDTGDVVGPGGGGEGEGCSVAVEAGEAAGEVASEAPSESSSVPVAEQCKAVQSFLTVTFQILTLKLLNGLLQAKYFLCVFKPLYCSILEGKAVAQSLRDL